MNKKTENKMAHQQIKISLKDITQLIPEFNGDKARLEEYIDKLQGAKKIIAPANENNLI